MAEATGEEERFVGGAVGGFGRGKRDCVDRFRGRGFGSGSDGLPDGRRGDEVEFPLDRGSARAGMDLLRRGLEAEHFDREGPFAFRQFERVGAVVIGSGGDLLVSADGSDECAWKRAILRSNKAALRVSRRLG